MRSWRRALLLGMLVWLIPFVVAFSISTLKGSWRSLFESIMPVTLAVVVVAFALHYFARTTACSVLEGLLLGIVWLVVSLLIDLPLMLSPPMSMQPIEYTADIGITYLMIPVITVGISASACRDRSARTS
jgi:hypothetical protein